MHRPALKLESKNRLGRGRNLEHLFVGGVFGPLGAPNGFARPFNTASAAGYDEYALAPSRSRPRLHYPADSCTIYPYKSARKVFSEHCVIDDYPLPNPDLLDARRPAV